MPRGDMIVLRRDTLANWAAAEVSGPALAAGERGYITDLNVDVVGDGAKKVAQLVPVGSGTYVSVGQTSVDVAAYDNDVSAAIAAQGAGKRYWLNQSAYSEAADVVLGYGTVLQGAGSAITTLTLSGTARVVTDGYDGLAGTNPQVSPGVGGFALRNLTVEGGGGVRIYGYAYEITDVNIRGANDWGFRSEWTNNDSPIPPHSSMECRINGLKVHHCAKGIVYDGPHDSVLSEIQSHFNSGDTGLVMGEKSNGTHIVSGHVYGVDHTMGLQMLGAGLQIENMQVEGANGPQVEIRKAGSSFRGRVYSAGGNENVLGIRIGVPGDVAASVLVDADVSECRLGAVDFTYDAGGSQYHIRTVQPAATPAYLGTVPPTSTARFTLRGGVTIGGWDQPRIVGAQHHSGAVYSTQVIAAMADAVRLEGDGGGGAVQLRNCAGIVQSTPAADNWKIYFATGTNANTVRMVAKGPSGTVTTILDNIPA